MEKEEKKISIVLVSSGSYNGRSSYLQRLNNKDSNILNILATIGVDFKNIYFSFKGLELKIQIWDTSGQERFRTTTLAYIQKCQGILYFLDSSSISEKKDQFLESIQLKFPLKPIVPVLNKIDLPQKHTEEELNIFLNKYHFKECIKISSLKNINLESPINSILELIIFNEFSQKLILSESIQEISNNNSIENKFLNYNMYNNEINLISNNNFEINNINNNFYNTFDYNINTTNLPIYSFINI